MISWLITAAHKKGRKVGICGQAPSDYPEFAGFLVKEGIDTISLNPDSVLEVITHIASVEAGSREPAPAK
jgi:pyruvate, water dikinase